MADWDEIERAKKEFEKATDKIEKEVRERIREEMKPTLVWDPEKVIDWILNDETEYASLSDRYDAAERQFPGITTIELNRAATCVWKHIVGTRH